MPTNQTDFSLNDGSKVRVRDGSFFLLQPSQGGTWQDDPSTFTERGLSLDSPLGLEAQKQYKAANPTGAIVAQPGDSAYTAAHPTSPDLPTIGSLTAKTPQYYSNLLNKSAPADNSGAQTLNGYYTTGPNAGQLVNQGNSTGVPITQTPTQQQNTTTATGAQPQQNAPTNQTGTVQPPTVNLQPGNTGTNVKQLQDYLVSQGLMNQADLANGGYGVYGPKTTAAVAALQQKLGVDNSSGPGFYGPKTMAGISSAQQGTQGGTTTSTKTAGSVDTTQADGTDPYAGMDPVQKQVKMYTDAYKALGLSDVKSQIDDVLKQQKDLTDEMNDKIGDVNNNPWLSEGVRVKEVQKLQDKYQTRLDTLTHLETLYDSIYKQGTAQVDNIVSGAQADIKATNDLAQKQADAAAALAKDNQVVSVGGREVLVNKSSGKVVADLGASKSAAAPKATAAERQADALSQFSDSFVPGAMLPGNIPVIDNNGFITPVAWKQAIADAPSEGLSRADFIKQFGYLLYSDKNGVSSAYGITPTEQKLVTGAL